MSQNKGSQQQPFEITLVLESGKKKTVTAKAATRKAAERRALKRNPAATHVDRSQKGKIMTDRIIIQERKSYGFLSFLFDCFMVIVTCGFWLIWIWVREMRKR